MQIIETKVYSYNELSKETQAKAIENNRDFNTGESFWSECVIEDRTAKLSDYGFNEPKIYFSGFWSQGDGACFIGKLDNDGLLKFITKEKTLAKYPTLVKAIKKETVYINIKITHTDRCYHEYSTSIEDYTEMQDNSELKGKLLAEYTEWYKTFDTKGAHNESLGWYYEECRDIYKHLEAEYDYQTSDESIAESLIANEMLFLETGKNY